jgi:hypothetical protein
MNRNVWSNGETDKIKIEIKIKIKRKKEAFESLRHQRKI